MSDIIEHLKTFQKLLPEKQNKYYQWIIEHGKLFTDDDRNKEKEFELIKQNYSHKEKECFFNSQILLTINNKYQYYEGWYITERIPIPIEHGFIVYDGKIIDITVNNRFKVIEYFGVRIPTEFVCIHIVKTGYSESMLFWYWKENFLDRKY